LHGLPEAVQRFAVARDFVVGTATTPLLTQHPMLFQDRHLTVNK
jgi:hypothetical protein